MIFSLNSLLNRELQSTVALKPHGVTRLRYWQDVPFVGGMMYLSILPTQQ